jgi:hypothetical protein
MPTDKMLLKGWPGFAVVEMILFGENCRKNFPYINGMFLSRLRIDLKSMHNILEWTKE